MNQDPNNPVAPNPAAPINTGFANPAAAAAPSMEAPAAAPTAPAMPDGPTIDPALLQQAIADVPDEALATTPEVPSAVPLDNIGAEAQATPEINPLTTATPAADFSAGDPAAATPDTAAAGVVPNPDDQQKTTPSVAFNDPANQPDAPAPHGFKKPAFIDKLKEKPVLLIVGGATIVIIALVLIIAFAV